MAETSYEGEVWCYEFWSCLWPNIGVDISSVADIKREAINCYASQVAYVNYVEGALGLNRFRGLKLGVGYSEAFFVSTRERLSGSADARGSVIGGRYADHSRGTG